MSRKLDPSIIAKGQKALAKWRKEKAAAEKKGGKALEKWNAEQAAKKAQRKVTPIMAIKAFCLSCVGDVRADITSCSAKQCPLYGLRPYQRSSDPD